MHTQLYIIPYFTTCQTLFYNSQFFVVKLRHVHASHSLGIFNGGSSLHHCLTSLTTCGDQLSTLFLKCFGSFPISLDNPGIWLEA